MGNHFRVLTFSQYFPIVLTSSPHYTPLSMWIANGIIKRRGTDSTEQLGKIDAQGVQWRDLSLVMARREIEVEAYGSGYYIDWIELVEVTRIMDVNEHVRDMVKTFKAAIPYEIENPPEPEPETEKPKEQRPEGDPE